MHNRTVPDLDYAFLADYAVVTAGKLTAVGASFTHISKPALPAVQLLAIAGRIRAPQSVESVPITLGLTVPDKSLELQIDATLTRDLSATPYNGKVGILFAASFQMPLSATGLYEVNLLIDGEHVRRLAFEVLLESAGPPGQS